MARLEKKEKKVKTEKKAKSAKKEKEVYEPLKGLMGNGCDYHIYRMELIDRVTAALIGIGVSLIVVYTFFASIPLALIVGVILAKVAQKPYQEYKRKKRLKNLLFQFKDLLEALTASYSAGDNTVNAFSSAINDLGSIHGEDADIVRELQIISEGIRHNINVEQLLLDFGERSGLDDVVSFAEVFEVCMRQGSDLKRVVGDTKDIIGDKIEMEMEIQTMLAGNNNELNIMLCMPVVIIVALGQLGGATITSNTPLNVIVKIICLGIFAAAYLMGRKIVNIKI